ncbi:unnamed protein product [Linum trigynum]|uniref:Transmembrane protein n=1 Tax=Linum trigynum TaxID=586398 RepID=A0AAV2D0D1_9ROSI
MGKKQEDLVICFITIVLFVCIILGGIFLGMYLFLPPHRVRYWYPLAGIGLVSMPWLFWFITYLYIRLKQRIYRNPKYEKPPRSSRRSSLKEPSLLQPPSDAEANVKPNDVEVNEPILRTPSDSSSKHVRFGGVVVFNVDQDENEGSRLNEHECIVV